MGIWLAFLRYGGLFYRGILGRHATNDVDGLGSSIYVRRYVQDHGESFSVSVLSYQNVVIEAMTFVEPPIDISMRSTLMQLRPVLKKLKIPLEGLIQTSGVKNRKFWSNGTTIAESAAKAAQKALSMTSLAKEDIECVVNTSVCKDYIEPSVASMIHGKLGLKPGCLNFDISNACLGFMNGISVVSQMIENQQIKAGLIVDSESSRQVIESTIRYLTTKDVSAEEFRKNFATLTLGSGAVAAVLTHSSISRGGHRVKGHVSLADTTKNRLCLGKPEQMLVEGRALLEAGVELAKKTWDLASDRLSWSDENFDCYICHQVSQVYHETLFKALGLPSEKAVLTFPQYGNVGPASIILTLLKAVESGRIQPGSKVAMMGIGSGLNCSMMNLSW